MTRHEQKLLELALRETTRKITSQAIRQGRLKPKACKDCNFMPEWFEKQNQAHHDDYDKPLDVTWLCQGCHIKRTSKDKRLKKSFQLDPI